MYTTARPTETSKHSVTAAASELLARSGFQPYRPEHHPAHAPPAFALDPAAYNPYHHGLYPPPHLQHAYRYLLCNINREYSSDFLQNLS